MPPKERRVAPVIDDIMSGEQLLRYAIAAQCALVLDETKISQTSLGQTAGFASGTITKAVKGEINLTFDQLSRLDEVLVTAAPSVEQIGELASLAARILPFGDKASLAAHTRPSMWRGILRSPSTNDVYVLIQASALMDNFLSVPKGRGSGTIRERYAAQIDDVVRRLILIGVAPPTARNVEALVLLGSLARHSFDITWPRIEDFIRRSPLGFRLWRAVTKLILLTGKDDEGLGKRLTPRLRTLIQPAESFREESIYPGRSLDLEVAITIPRSWDTAVNSADGADWVVDFLLARARNRNATLRERGTAALGLWQRSFNDGEPASRGAQETLNELIALFRSDSERPDIKTGLEWLATTMDYVRENNVAVCNSWPDCDQPWYRAVENAVTLLGQENIPEHIRPATIALFRHALLQNAGVARRRALDALLAGGWTGQVTRALATFLEDPGLEEWIRIRAIFALGFLQRRDLPVQRALVAACRRAFENLDEGDTSSRAKISEQHAALFAIGDIIGATSEEERARDDIRRELRQLLTSLSDSKVLLKPEMRLVARSMAYMLTFTAQSRKESDPPDLSQTLLQKLAGHTDPPTQKLANWALEFRFSPTGEVRPLLDRAEHHVW